MKTCFLCIVGNADFRIGKLVQLHHSFGVCGAHVRGGDNAQLAAPIGKLLQLGKNHPQAGILDERYQQIDAVRRKDFPAQFRGDIHVLPAVGEKEASGKGRIGTGAGFPGCFTGNLILCVLERQQKRFPQGNRQSLSQLLIGTEKVADAVIDEADFFFRIIRIITVSQFFQTVSEQKRKIRSQTGDGLLRVQILLLGPDFLCIQ